MVPRRIALLPLLFWPLALGAGERAAVKAEAAHVYARLRSSPDEIVTTLKRGDAVSVELTIVSSDGAWCEIAAAGGIRGFMLPADLQKEPPPPPPTAAVQPPAARPAAPGPAQLAGEDYMAPIHYWTRALAFTADQQTAVTWLAGELGVTDCRERVEAHVRQYERELTPADGPIPGPRLQRMARDYNSFAHACMAARLELLERLPAMMTPGQQADPKVLSSFETDLARQRQVLPPPDAYRAPR